MAKTKTIYIADDESEFTSEAECNAHNEFLKSEMTIEAFIIDIDSKKAAAEAKAAEKAAEKTGAEAK